MKRIALMVFRYLFIAPVWFFKIWYYGRSDKYTEQERYDLLRFITKKANKGGRVTIKTTGLENLPENNGYILFPNHQGLFDCLALFEASPRPLTVVMKKEVENLILVKDVKRLLRGQYIDRDDMKQSMKVILQMTKEVKEGRNYIIFAEGTRTREKNTLLPFKGGSFKSAMKAKCPIVPAAIIDSYKAFDTSSIKKLTVQVHFLEPIYYDSYKDFKSTEIAKEVQSRIEKVIRENE